MKDPGLDERQFTLDRSNPGSVKLDLSDLTEHKNARRLQDKIIVASTEKFSATVKNCLANLSAYNLFVVRLQNLSDAPLLVGITFTHGIAQDPKDFRITTSFSGGRELLPPLSRACMKFPIESFGIYGKPVGWKEITSVGFLISTEKFWPFSRDFSVAIHGAEFLRKTSPTGPRLTSTGLRVLTKARAIDDNKPTDRRVSSNFHKLEADFRGDTMAPFSEDDPGLLIAPPHNYPEETAEEIMRGKIMGQHFSSRIAWDANPVGELEWTHFLNRHHFIRPLIRKFVETRDRSIVEHISSIVTSWIEDCPVTIDSNGGAGATWETLTVAWRLREWYWIKGIIWPTGIFPGKTIEMMLRSIWEHARSLMDHQGHPNNWMIVESSALSIAGVLFPEFSESADWWNTGIKRLQKSLDQQFLPDGSHFEISPLYQSICVGALLELRHVAEVNQRQLDRTFLDTLDKAIDYLMEIVRPDFTWPSLNDSGSIDRNYCELFKKIYIFNNKPEYLWIASKGKLGKPLRSCVRVFNDSGISIIRKTQECDGQWAMLRSGPAGAFHSHNDLLSVEIYDKRTKWLVDPGITSYAPGPLADYYRSAGSHNTFVFDNFELNRTNLPFEEKIRSTRNRVDKLQYLDFFGARGESGEFADDTNNIISCKRTLLLARDSLWLIIEHVDGSGTHDVTHRWQFSNEIDKLDNPGDQSIMASSRRGKMLIQKMFPNHSSDSRCFFGSINPLSGWVSSSGSDRAAHCATFHTTVKIPTTFFWAIYCKADDGEPFPHLRLEEGSSGEMNLFVCHKTGSSKTIRIAIENHSVSSVEKLN